MDLTREERDRLLARKLPLIEKLNEQINRRQHEIMADDRLAENGHPNTQRSTSSYPNRRTDDNLYRNFRQKSFKPYRPGPDNINNNNLNGNKDHSNSNIKSQNPNHYNAKSGPREANNEDRWPRGRILDNNTNNRYDNNNRRENNIESRDTSRRGKQLPRYFNRSKTSGLGAWDQLKTNQTFAPQNGPKHLLNNRCERSLKDNQKDKSDMINSKHGDSVNRQFAKVIYYAAPAYEYRKSDNMHDKDVSKKKPVTLTPPPSPPKYNFLRDYRYDDSLDTIDNNNGKCTSKTTHDKSSNNSQQGHPNLTRDKFNNLQNKSNNNSYDVSKNRNHLADYTAIKKASIKPLFPQGFAGNNQTANSFFKKRSKTSTELKPVAMTHKPSPKKDNSIPPNDNESLNKLPQINKPQKSCRRHRRARHAAQGDRNFLIRTAYISIEDLTNTPSTSSRSESTPKRDNNKDRSNNLTNEKQLPNLPLTESPRHRNMPSKAPIAESALQNSLKSLSLTPNTNGIQDSFNRLQVSGGVFPLLDTPEYNIFDRVMNTDNNAACLKTSDLTELEKELIREILLEDPFDNNDKDPENGAQNMAADELYHQFIRSNSSQSTNNKFDKEVNADNISDTTECESFDCVSSPNNPIYSRLFRDIYDGHAEHKLTKGLRNNSENSSIDEEAPPKFIWDSAADIDSYLTT